MQVIGSFLDQSDEGFTTSLYKYSATFDGTLKIGTPLGLTWGKWRSPDRAASGCQETD